MGVVAVSEVPGYAAARIATFRALKACPERARVVSMPDGTQRASFATRTARHVLEPLPEIEGCQAFTQAAGLLRSIVESASNEVFRNIDMATVTTPATPSADHR